MGTTIFWVCALALFPPVALIFGPLQFVLGIIAQVGGLVVLFTDSVIPNQYVWGAITIFLIQCFPPIRGLGGIAAAVIAGPDPQGRDINLGDSIVGSVAGLIYNASWLDYAISNEGCWLIFINWFLACMGIWLFAGYTITNRLLKR
tara:strand:+ start:147 stop:584 length:438 start_codon:yes stop_codon:yes gene_type:complete